MISSKLDLPALEARIREALHDRYPGKDVALKIGIAADGRLHITLWPTKGYVFYHQRVHIAADGVVTFPEPDDGMTSLAAKPWSVRRTSGIDEATEHILELVDEAVAAAQERVDKTRAALLENRPSLTPTEEQLSSARAAWMTSQDQRRLLNACAWVQLGDWFYGHRTLLHSSLVDARHDTAAMVHAATLMRAVNNGSVLPAEQWCAENRWPVVGIATKAFPADPTEDERIAKEVKRGSLHLPLWDVSLDPVPDSVTDDEQQPRWIFEITGEFRALPVNPPGGEQASRMLICAGRYRVESTTQDGLATRVRLSYQDRLGDSPVANPVLLEIAGLIPGVGVTRMEGPRALYGPTYKETITLGITGKRQLEAIFDSAHPDRITTTFRPDGTFDGDNPYYDTWEFAPGDGRTVAPLPANAQLISAHVERLRDPRWLDCRKRLISALATCWRTTDEPSGSNGSFDLPPGGYVQWTRLDEPGSDVHIEINEGQFANPMPTALVNLLVMVGWNAPDDDFRNCWLRAGPPGEMEFRRNRRGFFGAANLILIALTIAMGVSLRELAVALGIDEPAQVRGPERSRPRPGPAARARAW